MRLLWHGYKYYPYEKELAIREVTSLLNPTKLREESGAIVVDRPRKARGAERLVYFSAAARQGREPVPTQQSVLERVNGNGIGRQSTRYSVHGLHEYKGKFNPQVAKAILNIFGAKAGQKALDPFCGSGTSLVECAHLGIEALGVDINPMAIFIANTKLQSLGIPAADLSRAAANAVRRARRSAFKGNAQDARIQYLGHWFTPEVLLDIERLRSAICNNTEPTASILLAIASNLLRDYSLQDPQDLRIRRRKTPLPNLPFLQAFDNAARNYCDRLSDTQLAIGVRKIKSGAMQGDAREARSSIGRRRFDLALTSPPYATALPYIDTQRLSLVWLGLVEPKEIHALEAQLVGSREIRGQRKQLLSALVSNQSDLPQQEAQLCLDLRAALTEDDGFRRQRMPCLLYRYFADMKETLVSILPVMKRGAPFALIVGGNHTILGGRRFDIDTPSHLTNLAVNAGWRHVETISLQTYQRFGLHKLNSTTSEALIILRA